MARKYFNNERFTGERALFCENDVKIEYSVFEDGESPLKESSDITACKTIFRWKYPFWYAKNVSLKECFLSTMARAGIWYSENVSVKDTLIEAPKNFRRCRGLYLKDVTFSDAAETLWSCDGVQLDKVSAKGDYFAMNSRNMEIEDLNLIGNYSFDGVENVTVRNSRLLSKDAFWNSNNVAVYDSFISGEYLGWNAKNLYLENCTIESLQGLCYIDNLVMKNCTLLNTNLAFEYSSVDADIKGKIISVLNPKSGVIKAEHIGSLMIEKDRVDPAMTRIVCSSIDETLDKAVY